jgi:hypothetical protein
MILGTPQDLIGKEKEEKEQEKKRKKKKGERDSVAVLYPRAYFKVKSAKTPFCTKACE